MFRLALVCKDENVPYLDAVDRFVSRAAQWGIVTLLDLHLLRAETHPDPLWWDATSAIGDDTPYKTKTVTDAWRMLANRFCGRWYIAGADLKNEPLGVTWGALFLP